MTKINYREWINVACNKPFTCRVMLAKMFQNERSCECAKNGLLYVPGGINSCSICSDNFSTFDGHKFLEQFVPCLIVWIGNTWKGILYIIMRKTLFEIRKFFIEF